MNYGIRFFRLFVLILCLGLAFVSRAQRLAKMTIDSCSADDFPTISGVLWSRNPDIDPSQLILKEDGVVYNAEWNVCNTDIPNERESKRNKRIVFLVAVNRENRSNALVYQDILRDALNENGFVMSGDEIVIVKYGMYDSNNNFALKNFTGSLDFTDDINDLQRSVDEIDELCSNSDNQEDMLWAIRDVMEALKKQTSDLPTALFVLSPNTGERRSIQDLSLSERCLSQDVSVYGFIYPKDEWMNKGNLETICPQSFGSICNEDDPSILLNEVKKCGENLIKRASGILLCFSFDTNNENDGKTHLLDVRLEDNSMRSDSKIVSYPDLNIIEWIAQNTVTFVVILILLLLLVFLIFYFRKNQQKMRDMERQVIRQNQERLEDNQRASEEKALQTDQDLKNIEKAITAERERLEREKQSKEDAKQEQRLQAEMRSRGNMPWIDYVIDNQAMRYQLEKSVTIVGRSKEADWVIPKDTISKKHFKIQFVEGAYFVTDLGSTNGLWLNKKKVESGPLKDQDVLDFGDVRAVFHI